MSNDLFDEGTEPASRLAIAERRRGDVTLLVLSGEMLVDVTFLAAADPGRGSEPSKELKLYLPKQLIHQGESESFVWLADQSSGVVRKSPGRFSRARSLSIASIFHPRRHT